MTHTGTAMTVELYRSPHSTQCVSSVVIRSYIYKLVLSPPVEYVINASTTVRANRETERPLAPDGDGRERWGTHMDNSEGGGTGSGWS